MNPQKSLILIPIFVVVMIMFLITMLKLSNKHSNQTEQQRRALIDTIKFKGKVINSKMREFAGRKYCLVCVKVDTCNIKDFYVLNDLCALKIKDGIATFSGGFVSSDYGIPNYVEVNMENDGKMKFFFANGKESISNRWLLHKDDLTDQELNLCN